MKYYCKKDLLNISIAEFADILKSDPSINYTDALLEDADTEFILDDADVFRQGVCQLFAFALQEEFGYKVYKISVKGGIHIFCKSPDGAEYIDVRGKTHSFREFILGSDVPITDEDSSEEYSFEEDDFSGDYYDIGLAFARELIRNDRERYAC